MDRVKTGINSHDEILRGVLREIANLAEDASDTGKTRLALQFIYNGIIQPNEPGLTVTNE